MKISASYRAQGYRSLLEPLSAVIGWRQSDSLDKLPVHRRATWPHWHTHIPMDNLEFPVHLTCMLCKEARETRETQGGTCQLHTHNMNICPYILMWLNSIRKCLIWKLFTCYYHHCSVLFLNFNWSNGNEHISSINQQSSIKFAKRKHFPRSL